ncbi:winged helix-turn-helix domain-containing protein [Haloarcula amylovorans]|uniref:winged helix-turn-helix domain-containing protein n=1 Tax=Haloarcula amylovorans TaxID=2562280 RepID=UPI001076A1D9|nr:winged helix-turn-helix domain-containing protein [Halomicroarcula amylolytica]
MVANRDRLTAEEVLQQFEKTDAPFLTATEIADELDVQRQAIHYRLQKLLDEGAVERKEAGSRAVGWWRVQD